MASRELFARYLRQRRELGETDIVLEPETIDALRGWGDDDESVATGSDQPAAAAGDTAAAGDANAAGDDQPAARDGQPTAGRDRPAAGADRSVGRPVRPAGPDAAGAREAVSAAPEDARSQEIVAIGSLEELGALARGCVTCGLASTRTTVVFGEGNPAARLVVVGEAPGADEDRTGRPFVGRAGKLLDTLLASIGFPRESVYICNVLKCRPPGNRNPRPDEVASCSPFLRRQLELIAPEAILACGTFPAQTLLQTNEPIGRLRGSVHEYAGIPFVPTYHPAALLRNPAWIRPVWEDLQRLRSAIDG
jgi:uracil-DNA glycosylase